MLYPLSYGSEAASHLRAASDRLARIAFRGPQSFTKSRVRPRVSRARGSA